LTEDPAVKHTTLAVLLLTLASCSSDDDAKGSSPPLPPSPSGYQALFVQGGFSGPVLVAAPPGDTTRLFVVEKTGTIRIMTRAGVLRPRPFLDVSSRVSTGSEQGLLGLAFHPSYATNGRFYVDYTDRSGDTRLVEFLVSSNPDSASATEKEILFVDQPYANHNGGHLAFGPDGKLYFGLGDGGSGGDPGGNGQNLGALLGKILRLDVDAGNPYAVPSDNPFVGRAGARGEIWSYGLRNPWRFSFDADNGDMLVADVGQDAWEEVDFEPAGQGGRNYGWNRMEGTHCFPPGSSCNPSGLTMPVTEYDHRAGCSITGGYVYRGVDLPELRGTYFYGDYCTGIVRSLRIMDSHASQEFDWTSALRTRAGGAMDGLSSFGVDGLGELYLVLLGGEVYRLARKP
jgi:glucose/arabinose dehydrogenase